MAETLRSQGLRVEQAVLFGSLAREDAHRSGDVDIAIVSPDFEGKDIFERAELTRRAEVRTIKRFMVPLDLIVLTPQEFEEGASLSARFAQEGEPIPL